LVPIDEKLLPAIGHYEIQLMASARASGPAMEALSGHIVQSFQSETEWRDREAAE
jgi:hypothetical protein